MRRVTRALALVLLVAAACASAGASVAGPERDERLAGLPPGRWIEIHRQGNGDEVTFTRQAHAGSAFDTRRGRIVVFGSDEHGRDWTNSPLYFDVAQRRWRR